MAKECQTTFLTGLHCSNPAMQNNYTVPVQSTGLITLNTTIYFTVVFFLIHCYVSSFVVLFSDSLLSFLIICCIVVVVFYTQLVFLIHCCIFLICCMPSDSLLCYLINGCFSSDSLLCFLIFLFAVVFLICCFIADLFLHLQLSFLICCVFGFIVFNSDSLFCVLVCKLCLHFRVSR